MFATTGSVIGFLAGVILTMGLLLSPYLVPGGAAYGVGFQLSSLQAGLLIVGGLGFLALTLWVGGKLVLGGESWKQPRVMLAIFLIAFNANALYVAAVDLFALKLGLRALIALLGVPVIYGNISAVLGKTTLKAAMLNIFSGALATMGAGFIITALIRGW